MHKNSFYISFGVWLIIVTQLGIPGSWRDILIFVSGIFIILVSLGPSILNKLQSKPKLKRKQKRINSENMPSQNTDLKFSASEYNQTETEKEI